MIRKYTIKVRKMSIEGEIVECFPVVSIIWNITVIVWIFEKILSN
jgi:hypothetical protein